MHIFPAKVARELKTTRYFTGAPCKRGHVAERLTAGSRCVECDALARKTPRRKAYIKAYHAERADSRASYFKEWAKQNAARKRETDRAWYLANRAHVLAVEKARREANRESVRLVNAEWRKRNRSRKNQTDKAYRERNREIVRANKIKRKSALRDRLPNWDQELTAFATQEAAHHAETLKARFNFDWHIDHIYPLQGQKVSGLHVWNNLQLLPAYTNIAKGNKPVFIVPFSWLKAYS